VRPTQTACFPCVKATVLTMMATVKICDEGEYPTNFLLRGQPARGLKL
jgi:hypothetical protein